MASYRKTGVISTFEGCLCKAVQDSCERDNQKQYELEERRRKEDKDFMREMVKMNSNPSNGSGINITININCNDSTPEQIKQCVSSAVEAGMNAVKSQPNTSASNATNIDPSKVNYMGDAPETIINKDLFK